MKWAIIIESDAVVAADLVNILQDVDPAIVPHVFPDLSDLQVWLTTTIAEKKEKQHEDAAIVLMIGSQGIFNKGFIGLLLRLREFLFRRGLAVRETPPAFVLTAFDEEQSKATRAQHEIISNIIYKPIDRIIASQALINALNPGKAFSLKHVYAQKSNVLIEALKDVQIVRLSEYGFTSVSDRAIPVGSITKFHHQIFVTGPRPGVYARCRSSIPNDQVPSKYTCHFTYYAITAEQIRSVRRYLKLQPKTALEPSFPFYKDTKDLGTFARTKLLSETEKKSLPGLIKKQQPRAVVIVDSDRVNSAKMKDTVTRNFSNVTVVEYKSYLNFLLELDPQYTESKTPEKPAFPIPTGLKLVCNIKRASIVKTDPDTIDTAEIFGFAYKGLLNKDNFLLDRVFEEDRDRLANYFKHPQFEPVAFRFLHSAGHRCYVEFKIDKPAHASSPEGIFAVRELSPTEKLEFLKKHRKFKGVIDFLILCDSAMGATFSDRVTILQKSMEACKVIPETQPPLIIGFSRDPRKLIDEKQGTSTELTAMLPYDFDRTLFLQLCAVEESGLDSAEVKKAMSFYNVDLLLKASTDVAAEELSEAGIVFKYYREIKPGEFRSFHLPLEVFGQVVDDGELIELLGRCHHSVKIDEKSGYMTYFALFGMTDIFLKHVRSWMKRHYVNSKSEEAA